MIPAASQADGCDYCKPAHPMSAEKATLRVGEIEALREGRELTDESLEALRRFTVQVVETRGRPQPEEVDAFLAAGCTQAQILEVIVGVALKTLSNYTNHIADTPLDEAFAKSR